MSPAISPVAAELRSFGGESVRCELVEPNDIDELFTCIRVACQGGRRITFRGLGFSLDSQSLNTDLIIALGRLRGITFANEGNAITVEAGVSTGELVQAAFKRGLFPAVLVTTSGASVAGMVSGNCVSRFTPTRGCVGDHVLELELATVGGEKLVCNPERDSDVFHGVVGGLGYLGCITRVTMRLDEAKDQVETRVVLSGELDEVLTACVPPFPDAAPRYAVLMPTLKRGIAYASRYVTGERLRRYTFPHQPRSLSHLVGQFLMRTDTFNVVTWWLAYHTHATRYVDPILDHAFFMDGNARMRHLGWKFGFEMRFLQQSFLLPVARTRDFLAIAKREFERQALWPTISDVLYCPVSAALLSANFELEGFLATFGFEIMSSSRMRKVTEALVRLSAACRELGGRVRLAKSVRASPNDVAAMYSHALPAFVQLKRRLDPQGILKNAFLKRVFPAMA